MDRYDVQYFSIHENQWGTVKYKPDDQYQPDYPVVEDSILSESIYFTDRDKIPWVSFRESITGVISFNFQDVPRSVATAVELAIQDLEGTVYLEFGTYGTLVTCQRAFLEDAIVVNETETGLFGFEVSFNFNEPLIVKEINPLGWGTTGWGTTWGF